MVQQYPPPTFSDKDIQAQYTKRQRPTLGGILGFLVLLTLLVILFGLLLAGLYAFAIATLVLVAVAMWLFVKKRIEKEEAKP